MTIKVGFVSDLNISDEKIRNFYKNNWPRKIALSDKVFYDWQFISPPDNLNKNHCVVAYDDKLEIILGVMGLNKRKFIINNQEKKGAELTTWVISKEGQVPGLGAKMLSYILSNFEILIGMGISKMALPFYMRFGFRYMKAIPRFIKVINFENIKEFCIYDPIAVSLINSWKKRVTPKKVAYQLVNNDQYLNVDASLRMSSNHFSRDVEHLIWRYSKHPYFKYLQFLIPPDANSFSSGVYVVLREELTIKNFKMLHVIDLFGDESCIGASVDFIQTYALENEFDAIDFYCTSSQITRFMIASGWFSINDDDCFKFPHLFHPIEMRDPPTTSLIYWAKDDFQELADISRLYITKQDADLDRPTGYTLLN